MHENVLCRANKLIYEFQVQTKNWHLLYPSAVEKTIKLRRNFGLGRFRV